MKNERQKSTQKTAPAWMFTAVVPLSLLWMEVVFRTVIAESFFASGLWLTALFTIPTGLFLSLLCTFAKPKANYWITVILLAFLAIVFCSQIVYYGVFDTFYTVFSVKNVGQVMQFWWDTLLSIWRNLIAILLTFVPVGVYAVLGKRLVPARKTAWGIKGLVTAVSAVLYGAAVAVTLCSTSGGLSPSYLYTAAFDANASMQTFGVIQTAGLDVRFLVFGSSLSDDGGATSLPVEPQPEPDTDAPIEYGDNVIEGLDFEALAASETDKAFKQMHEYFGSVTPTQKNEYTGKFEGKNLIFIVAEGFSPYAVDETLTPTLYKLAHEGIQCTNYYTPGWGVSTSDGEYSSLLGLMPVSGLHSMEYSANRNMYFAPGNRFQAAGYNTYAFHNHTYTYYGRDKSHPNLGYTYQAIGNGLKLDYSEYYTKSYATRWPNSDYLMAKATADSYMDSEEPFHTYYLTVSGHMLYTFMGNSMSAYHKDKVKDLPYSDSVKAYLACQIELDLMVEELIRNLEERGIAEETVIVVTADHYPYGLQQQNETDYYSELAGYDTSSVFDKYRNTLIMWHKGLESIVVEEPTYSIDLLPTLYNLFGIEYDSRLLMGRDFLSSASSLVCFADRSWETDLGKYNAKTGEFTPNEGAEVPEGYVKTVRSIVEKKFQQSASILRNDYYNRLFG